MKNAWMSRPLLEADPDIANAINHEARRQHDGLELIASENFVSQAVLQAMGSVFTNKYAEGYPGRRYYGGVLVGVLVPEPSPRPALLASWARPAHGRPPSRALRHT